MRLDWSRICEIFATTLSIYLHLQHLQLLQSDAVELYHDIQFLTTGQLSVYLNIAWHDGKPWNHMGTVS